MRLKQRRVTYGGKLLINYHNPLHALHPSPELYGTCPVDMLLESIAEEITHQIERANVDHRHSTYHLAGLGNARHRWKFASVL